MPNFWRQGCRSGVLLLSWCLSQGSLVSQRGASVDDQADRRTYTAYERSASAGLCGTEVLDVITTCSTNFSLYSGSTIANVTSSPALCCQYCQEKHPLSAYSGYWGSSSVEGFNVASWCSCYQYCNVTRCVSTDCVGDKGGNTLTQALPKRPPPPPLPPIELVPECGVEFLDSDTTCSESDRYDGGYAEEGINNTPDLCCQWCRSKSPKISHGDWWYINGGKPWCNCYAACDTTRCVSKKCWGADGGNVTTLRLPMYSPPCPPNLPAPCPPNLPARSLLSNDLSPRPPPPPPAPNLQTNGSVAVINDAAYAEALIVEAIALESITTVWLYASVTLASGALPEVVGSLSVLGLCDEAGGGGETRCELDGASHTRLFTVDGTLQLEHLVMTHGSASDGGALRLAPGSTAVLRDCVVRECLATARGGFAFLSADSSLVLHNCRLLRNSANLGGAIYMEPGAATLVNQSSVHMNVGSTLGGGVYMEGTRTSKTQLQVWGGSSFLGNSAELRGGAVYATFASVMMLEGSSATNNTAGASGGAFCDHQLTDFVFGSGVTLTGNAAGATGGAVYLHQGSSITVGPNVILQANRALENGAAIWAFNATVTVTSSLLRGNYAGGAGGAVSAESETTEVIMHGALVESNAAESASGGGVHGIGPISLNSTSMVGNTAGAAGGGCYGASTVHLRASQVHSNSAHQGAGIAVGAGAEVVFDMMTVVDSNSAEGAGGGCHAEVGASVVVTGESIISGNSAGDTGGGLNVGSNVQILVTNRSQVLLNRAQNAGGGIAAGSDGTVLVMDARSQVLQNSGTHGGGLICYEALLDGCRISENTGRLHGGGVFVKSAAAMLNTVIEANTATGNGAGIQLQNYAMCQLGSHTVVSGNVAQGNGGGVGGGSRLGVTVSSGTQIVSNEAGSGGGIFVGGASTCSMRESSVVSNTALHGGGFYVSHNGVLNLVNGTLVEDNTASGDGGGIYIEGGGTFALTNASVVNNNFCSGLGGGLFIGAKASALVSSGSQVAYNGAIKEGGGLFLGRGASWDSPTQLVVNAAMVSYNRVWRFSGGGICAEDFGIVTLEGANVTSNRAKYEGGGIMSYSAAINVFGCTVIQANTAENGGGMGTNPRNTWSIPPSMGSTHEEQEGAFVQECLQSSAWQDMVTGDGCPEGIFIARNVAEQDGAAVEISEGSVVLREACVAGNKGTSIVFARGSLVDMQHTGLVNNSGCGLRLANRAAVTVAHCTFAGQESALGGGGLQLDSGSSGALRACHFQRNVAAQQGGAVHSSGELNVTASVFEGNTGAEGGGAVFLVLHQRPTHFLECNFTSNAAWAEGERAVNGAVFLLTEAAGADTNGSQGVRIADLVTLTSLRYDANSAAGGGSVGFWKPLNLTSAREHPACEACVVASSNVAAYGNAQGWATQAVSLQVDPVQAEISGGHAVTSSIIVRVVDIHGDVVTSDSSSVVQISFEDSRNRCGQTQGAHSVVVARGEANFATEAGIVIGGEAGTDCHAHFTVDLKGSGTAYNTTVLPLRACVPGETVMSLTLDNIVAEVCEACPSESISFKNESECIVCKEHLEADVQDGVRCLGMDHFVICQGYYVAPNAQYCGDDALCFLKRVVACEVEDACTTSDASGECAADDHHEGRSGAGAAGVGVLQLCGEGYGSGVVNCASGIPIGCSEGYFPALTADSCNLCPSREDTAALTLSMASLMGMAALMLLMFFGRFLKQLATRAVSSTLSGEGLKDSIQVLKARQALSLMLGYFQVISQLQNVFQAELVPAALTRFLRATDVVNLDAGLTLNFVCFSHHFLGAKSSFWFDFWQAVATPSLIALLFLVLYPVMLTTCGSGTEAATRCIRATIASLALFVMMFVHPSVSTVVFQVFNCEKFYFDDEGMGEQYWLELDYSIECFTGTWYVAVVFALIAIATFVFGFPLGIFLVLRHLRSYVKVSMARVAAERHLDLMQDRRWILILDADQTLLDTRGSLCVDPSADAVSRRQREISEDVALHVEVYVRKDTFAELADSPGAEAAREGMGAGDMHGAVQGGSAAGRSVRMARVEICPLGGHGAVIGGPRALWEMHEKDDMGDAGIVTKAAVTRMDEDNAARVLGQFVAPFEDEFYYWQCYEIMRRLAMTGFVLLVKLTFGSEHIAIIYALIVSVIAIALHQRYSPFKSDALDELQLTILFNQFSLQVAVTAMEMSSRSDEGGILGVVLLVLQCLFLTYAMTLIGPAFRPVMLHFFSKLPPEKVKAIKRVKNRLFICGSSASKASGNVDDAPIATATVTAVPHFEMSAFAFESFENPLSNNQSDSVEGVPCQLFEADPSHDDGNQVIEAPHMHIGSADTGSTPNRSPMSKGEESSATVPDEPGALSTSTMHDIENTY
ncbi:hypothetical protein CYMTET_51978 [Cymbomonas tetramitiformis]|uniref:Right handed beta helix domain-containing protein n=1 Tax=Cymbomonas tetramitiformis TaxID=36881 RepID=A0AAE0BK53_9CHLO|nr:hypothetical protein CYMTET_51978 [Cymbomonas tetramitiformis]